MKRMNRILAKAILIMTILSIIIFVRSSPYSVSTSLEPTFYSQTKIVDFSSYSLGLGGDYQSASVSWSANTTDGDLTFVIRSPVGTLDSRYILNSSGVFYIGEPEGNQFLSHANNGTVFLDREYFLQWPYDMHAGGSYYRGVKLYFRSESFSPFLINISVSGYVWRHFYEPSFQIQKFIRSCIVASGLVAIFIILIVSKKEEAE